MPRRPPQRMARMKTSPSLRVAIALAAWVSSLALGCTVGAPSSMAVSVVDAGISPTDAAPTPDAGPLFTPEERFVSACVRWHDWTMGESASCEECRSSNCAGVAIRAELHAHECPGEFECVQDTCYPDGTASSIDCDCVLPCMTVSICRDLWIDAMDCVTQHCSEACGERPPS